MTYFITPGRISGTFDARVNDYKVGLMHSYRSAVFFPLSHSNQYHLK